MFTLGQKMRVLNANDAVKIYSPANAERTTAAAVAYGDKLVIDGFASFSSSDITNIKLVRAKAAVAESKDFTVVVPSSLQVGDVVQVSVAYKTTRYQSELKTNIMDQGQPFIFQSVPVTTATAAGIRTAIIAGFDAFKAIFKMQDNVPFIIEAGAASDRLRVTVKAGYESVSIAAVGVRRVDTASADYPVVYLALQATITAGNEGRGLGKFLEESIRMSNYATDRQYGIDTTDTRVDLRAKYTELSFTVNTTYTKDTIGAPTGGSDIGATASRDFLVYFNEATTLGADQTLEKLAALAIEVADNTAGIQATLDATPDLAIEVLIIADDTSVALSKTDGTDPGFID